MCHPIDEGIFVDVIFRFFMFFNYSTGTTPNIMKIKGVGTETLKSYKVVAGSGINHSGFTTFVFLSLNMNFFLV